MAAAVCSVYCRSTWCSHDAKINADWLPDDRVPLDLDPRMVCTACGLIGAETERPAQDMRLRVSPDGGVTALWQHQAHA